MTTLYYLVSHLLPVFILICVSFVSLLACGSESCDSVSHCTSSRAPATEKYSAKWQSYELAIAAARKEYEDPACETSTCSCYARLIERDLEPFESVSRADLDEIHRVHSHSVRYQLIDGRVYRSKDCLFPFRCKGVEHFLLQLAREDPELCTEFAINFHDWPYINKHFPHGKLPLFSFSKTQHYYDIAYPAWTFWAGGPAISLYPTGIGRWDLFQDKLAGEHEKWPWQKKAEKAFFRGSRTSAERDNLVRLSRRRPSLVDAAYTKNQAWKSPADTLGAEPAQEVSLEDHCQYRFLFNFRGVAASFRFKHLFLCGSTVLHVGHEWTEFFYPLLKPWIHYVPVEPEASEEDLEQLLRYLQANSKDSKRIAEAGRDFILNHLRMNDVKCYWRLLLAEYTKKLAFAPKMNTDYILIKDDN